MPALMVLPLFCRLVRSFSCVFLAGVMLVSSAAAKAEVPMITAHRGASHDAPENTLAAFRLAWDQNADAIEGDFRLSADGEIVCIHDADTRRTCGVQLVVAETPFTSLRDLDYGRWKAEASTGEPSPTRAEVLEARRAAGTDYSVIGTLTNIVPNNIFADLADSRPLSIIGVVVFGLLFGIAAALVGEENPERGEQIRRFIETTQAVVMRLVKIVISLTPYGVLALMTRVIVTTDGSAILNLISFVVASYIAIAIMFVVHTALIGAFGGNIRSYFQKVWPVLTFAFVTRSSAATIPLTIRAQIEELNVPAPIANIAASFGATIGQNGCAGLYPAMLAVMVAASGGTEISLEFVISLVLIVAIGSFGIAGVGGGATNAALVVLPALGFPVTIAALLISIEPLIDMARTALNVNGSITAGIITSKFLGSKDTDGVLADSDV